MMDMGDQVLVKLRNKAQKSGMPFQLHLQLFCQEEFLRRLSLSKYVNNLVLKGGLFIYTLTNFESRATIDIDFLLRNLPANPAEMQEIVEEILAINTGNNYISFLTRGYEEISIQRKYRGISFQVIGHIKNTRTPFNVDLGVEDIIIPKADMRKIPVQLDNYEKPMVATYSLESTIAEKFDAILQRLQLTSRMKDFYDIFYLSHAFDYDGRQLQQAIFETLQNRGTYYDANSLDKIVSFSSDEEMQVQWRRFLDRSHLPMLSFDYVLHKIDSFLNPVWKAIVSENELFETWYADKSIWEASNSRQKL